MELADLFTRSGGSNPDSGVFSARIEGVNADGTVDLSYRGSLIFGAQVLGWYTPASGAIVKVARLNVGTYLVLGSTRTSNPTSVDVIASYSLPWNVQPVSRGIDLTDNPGGKTDPYLVTAYSSASFRQRGGWDNTKVIQGAYTTSYGWYTGCWFYGLKPQALRGVTVESLKIHIKREVGSTRAGAIPIYFWPHPYTSRPGEAPRVYDSINGQRAPSRVPGVLVGNTATYNLPKVWGQALVEGRIKGFAVRILDRNNYCVLSSVNDYPASGRLTIDWTQ